MIPGGQFELHLSCSCSKVGLAYSKRIEWNFYLGCPNRSLTEPTPKVSIKSQSPRGPSRGSSINVFNFKRSTANDPYQPFSSLSSILQRSDTHASYATMSDKSGSASTLPADQTSAFEAPRYSSGFYCNVGFFHSTTHSRVFFHPGPLHSKYIRTNIQVRAFQPCSLSAFQWYVHVLASRRGIVVCYASITRNGPTDEEFICSEQNVCNILSALQLLIL